NKKLINQVLHTWQTTDYSQGRNPDGATPYAFFRVPSPDVANPQAVSPTFVPLLPYNANWRYNGTGNNLGTAWFATNYNDGVAGWSTGTGVLNHEPSGLPGVPSGTDLNTDVWTHYFRTTFNLSSNPATTVVQLQGLFDDGAVIYINGQELLVAGQTVRVNMPGGPINFQTPASSTIEATVTGPITIPASFLRSGQNFVAVEVHQASFGSSDVVMGVKIDAVIPPA